MESYPFSSTPEEPMEQREVPAVDPVQEQVEEEGVEKARAARPRRRTTRRKTAAAGSTTRKRTGTRRKKATTARKTETAPRDCRAVVGMPPRRTHRLIPRQTAGVSCLSCAQGG